MVYDLTIYGEFDYIVRSFQFVAAMFSPTSHYIGLIAVFGIMAIFFTAIFAISSTTMGKGSIQSWFMYLFGTIVLITMITSPKSTINIHDLTTNQFRTIGGVPTAMATIAYIENKIELLVVETITTVMSPIVDYETIGKGKGFELLTSMQNYAGGFFTKQPYTQASLEAYWQECVVPDISLGFMSEDAIYKSDNIWESIKSDTRSRTSQVYSVGNMKGVVKECRDAWTEINNQLTDASLNLSAESECIKHYGDAGAAVASCKNSLKTIVENIIVPSSSLNSYFRSYLVAYSIQSSSGFLTQALADVNRKYMSSAAMAEKQVPRLKGMLYGMIIGIFPLLVGFIWFKPLKTVTFYLGMFLLMIIWSSIDTFMDMQYQNEVMNLFKNMKDLKLGINQMFDISSVSADAVALYGSGRWLALGLATAISSAITGVSSYAISQMGTQLASTAQGTASEMSGSLGSTGKSMQEQKAAGDLGERLLAEKARANNFGVPNWSGMTDQTIQNKTSSMGQAAAISGALGGSFGAGAAQGQSSATQQLVGIGGAAAQRDQASALGMDLQSFGNFTQRGNTLNADDAQKLNNHFGVDTFTAGQQLTLGLSDGKLSNMALSSRGAEGESIRQTLDNNGNVSLTEKNGGSYNNYSQLPDGSQYGQRIYQDAKGEHQEIYNGLQQTNIDSNGNLKTTTELMRNENGKLNMISRSIEGDGYVNYREHANGTIIGDHTFTDKDGVSHTQHFNGSTMSEQYTQNGQEITQSHALVGGEWIETSKQIGNNIQLSNEVIEMAKQGNYSALSPHMFDENGKATAEAYAIHSTLYANLSHIKKQTQSSAGMDADAGIKAGVGLNILGNGGGISAGVAMKLGSNESVTIDNYDAGGRQLLDTLGKDTTLTNEEKAKTYFDAYSEISKKGVDQAGYGVGASFINEVGIKLEETFDDVKNAGGTVLNLVKGK